MNATRTASRVIDQSDLKTSQRKQDINVGVIGAGVCGLVSVKICLENGFNVTCFERSNKYGGLWQYRPDNEDPNSPFEASVMKTTILNTPKELSSFSDFPPPAHLPNFMRHNHYMDYIHSYVERFQLKEHLKLEHEIVKCWPEWRRPATTSNNANQNGHIKWLVQVRHLRTTEQFLYEFDRLMVAVGHHNIPFVPAYEGQQRFKGQILHSAQLKDIQGNKNLANKRIAVVGFGNSACDAANDIAQVADKCYVSCHRGQWFTGRQLARNGNRWQQYLENWLPTSYNDRKLIKKLECQVDHKTLGLKPKHKPSELTPAINNLIPYRILTGSVILKGSIKEFTENGIKFEGEDDHEEHDIDVAILATGYEARMRFLDEFELGIRSPEYNNEYELFLNIFAPKLRLPSFAMSRVGINDKASPGERKQKSMDANNNSGEQTDLNQKMTNQNGKTSALPNRKPVEAVKSLAFIGLVQPNGSLTVISEMQARYACLVFKGELELPKMNKMLKHMRQWRSMRSKTVRSHSRDQLIGSYLFYMETMAKLAGVMPNLTKLFFKDYALWKALMFGPTVPYQYRLSGPGYWPEARQTIMTTNDRIQAGINEGKNYILYRSRKKCLHDSTSSNNNNDGGKNKQSQRRQRSANTYSKTTTKR